MQLPRWRQGPRTNTKGPLYRGIIPLYRNIALAAPAVLMALFEGVKGVNILDIIVCL